MIYPTEEEVAEVRTLAPEEVTTWYIRYFCELNHLTH